jgi:hypothetical protein
LTKVEKKLLSFECKSFFLIERTGSDEEETTARFRASYNPLARIGFEESPAVTAAVAPQS